MNKIDKAIIFAAKAHAGQVRKYSGIPYITHPLAVMEIVSTVEHDEDMLVAAILHDTVEDTETTINDISIYFGNDIAELVDCLTDASKPSDGNRALRKKIDRLMLASAPPQVKTIKLADLIHNSESISKCDPEFAKVYMAEKKLLLGALIGGDKNLMKIATKIVNDYYNGLK
jgi:(p)ppGpp synthase/HD superfamily hydrolase